MTASGLNPVIIMQNTIKMLAMELREAKKPLVVEKSPIRLSAKNGKLINGDKKTLSTVVRQDNNNLTPAAKLLKKLLISKFGAKSNFIMASGWLEIFTPKAANPVRMIRVMRIRGILGSFLIIKRRCG